MNNGELIKYYRIFKGMTQKQVGDGICTPGHISKIESGHLPVTKDKLDLFNRRLGIDIEHEGKAYHKLQTELDMWHDVMIKQINGKVELLKETIEQNPLVKIETLNGTYKLLKARYLIGKGDIQGPEFLLNQFSSKRLSFYMREYDNHLYYHVKGMFELLKGHAKNAIAFLQRIDGEIYTNFEYYYHLALAYQQLDQHDQASHHSEISLHHFKETYNFTRCIDAATVQLVSAGKNGKKDLEELEVEYEELIQHCDNLHDHRRKAILYMNLGNVYRDMRNDRRARDAFQTAYGLLKHEPHTWAYINTLFGYIDSSLYVDASIHKEKYASLIDEGLRYARNMKDPFKESLFTMLETRVHEGEEAYHHYIESVIIPLLKEEGQLSQCHHYIQKLCPYTEKNGIENGRKECVLN
ncbi:hypothetical protein CN378_00565 [Bacillus sp. AFS015802]|uniref:helix-turn-helix domain-containing protein n=1 Tax=Bacillus sp. AFS015802 TaxID=2033486 RepID=UPI000BF983AE|nr:helix-turn-helix transcriptional regulator [Bacillus sp. AFS015802]PFA70321.1 hypothetical protein CN378_00565 [Bacillus sp. AFS015802]